MSVNSRGNPMAGVHVCVPIWHGTFSVEHLPCSWTVLLVLQLVQAVVFRTVSTHTTRTDTQEVCGLHVLHCPNLHRQSAAVYLSCRRARGGRHTWHSTKTTRTTTCWLLQACSAQLLPAASVADPGQLRRTRPRWCLRLESERERAKKIRSLSRPLT